MIKPLHTIISIAGLFVIILAFAQIITTPIVVSWLKGGGTSGSSFEFSVEASFVHLFVGILLVPFGISTLFTATGIRAGQHWARGICYTNSAVIMLLPLLVDLLFGSYFFDSALSVVINSSIVLIGGIMILSLLWMRG